MGTREHLLAGLLERGRVPPWWTPIAVRMGRLPLAAALAMAPAVLLYGAALLAPPDTLGSLVETENVHDAFSRFMSGIATATSIAVSVAILTLRRDLGGIRTDEGRLEANLEFRRDVRERTGGDPLPLRLGPFMEHTLLALGDQALDTRQGLSAEEAGVVSEGLTLGEFLQLIERRSREQAAAMAAVRQRPDHLLIAALDFESETTGRLAARFARMEGLREPTREKVARLRESLDNFALAQRFMKSLDVQWSLTRMCIQILASTIPSIAVAAAMTLLYGAGAVEALGGAGAAALVCGALAVVIFPVACFVSYLLRFLIVNQHTLPAEGFLLGPEAGPLRR